MKYILVLDEGTTSTRACIYDEYGKMIGSSQEEFTQIYPTPGYVEHNPLEIFSKVLKTIEEALKVTGLNKSDLNCLGITNQRETVVMWDKETGELAYNALVWQCYRTSKRCEELISQGFEEMVRGKTGLKIDSYFSASKMEWLLENVPLCKKLLKENRLLVGTMDTFLLWKLSEGKIYRTDYTNASRTMLFNIQTLEWDKELCDLFHIPMHILPEVCPSSFYYGDMSIMGYNLPICGVAGDQQASLFGQCCFNKGDLKITYGTGCFLLLQGKEERFISKHGLITSLGCETNKTPSYVLEGSVFIGGALIQWLRDGLKLISTSAESEELANRVPDTNGVYIVPAFNGLGAPYWNRDASGMITGITRGTSIEHIVRASLEAIAFQVNDVIWAMSKDLGVSISSVKVDGGATANSLLMQLQSDISNLNLFRPFNREVTSLGACYLAGLCFGIWKKEDLPNLNKEADLFSSNISKEKRDAMVKGWTKAIHKSFS